MNDEMKKVIDNIVWWIPNRKLRDAIRTLLTNLNKIDSLSEKLDSIENKTSMCSYFNELICDKLEIEDLNFTNINYPHPPNEYKRMNIIRYAKNYDCKIGIETGTLWGDTAYFCKDYFKKFYTIELSDYLYSKAYDRFKNCNNVVTLHGDSSKILPSILEEINEKAIFWLDGHYSGGITAMGEKETPIMEEIKFIFNHKIKEHIILIDDARCFGVDKDFPTIKEFEDYIKSFDNDVDFSVKNDIIRIVQSKAKQSMLMFEYGFKKAA